VNEVGAILISVTMVLVFGEIVPQSICKRFGLGVGYWARHLVWVLLFVALPISWPLGRLLDRLLGEEEVLFRRAQLKALVDIHGHSEGHGGDLTTDETTIISGALDMTHKTAGSAMTPIERVQMVSADTELSWEAVRSIAASGHSRLPVHAAGNPNAVVGLLLVKELFGHFSPADLVGQQPVRRIGDSVTLRSLPRMNAATPLYTALNFFQTGRSHMALVTTGSTVLFLETPSTEGGGGSARVARATKHLQPQSPRSAGRGATGAMETPAAARSAADTLTPIILTSSTSWAARDEEVLGIITLEDVLEELLGEEILDEHDRSAGGEGIAQCLVEEQLAAHLKTPGPAPMVPESADRGDELDSPQRASSPPGAGWFSAPVRELAASSESAFDSPQHFLV